LRHVKFNPVRDLVTVLLLYPAIVLTLIFLKKDLLPQPELSDNPTMPQAKGAWRNLLLIAIKLTNLALLSESKNECLFLDDLGMGK
jgi:hypothetical protein